MSKGILEQIYEQNHKIITMVTALTAMQGATSALPPSANSVAVPPIAGENDIDGEIAKSLAKPPPAATQTYPYTNEAGQLVDKEGTVWADGVHASTKNCTVKGIWKKSKSKKPTSTATPATPPVAGVATPPPVAGVNDAEKASAMASIVIISDEHDVSYDLILKVLHDKMSAKTFDELTPDQYPQADTLFKSWVDMLNTATSEIERTITAGGEAGADGVKVFYVNQGTADITGMNVEKLEAFLSELTPYREEWENYAASIA